MRDVFIVLSKYEVSGLRCDEQMSSSNCMPSSFRHISVLKAKYGHCIGEYEFKEMMQPAFAKPLRLW